MSTNCNKAAQGFVYGLIEDAAIGNETEWDPAKRHGQYDLGSGSDSLLNNVLVELTADPDIDRCPLLVPRAGRLNPFKVNWDQTKQKTKSGAASFWSFQRTHFTLVIYTTFFFRVTHSSSNAEAVG